MSKEITITVFSKNRAAQASACIDSLYKNLSDIDKVNISVLYKSTSPSFVEGYNKAADIHSDKNVKWIKETDFKTQLREIVVETQTPLTMFLVDDIIFVNTLSLQDKQVQMIKTVPELLATSLRLHSGVTHCYATDQPSQIPKFVKGCVWQWANKQGDWGYPMSVDGNIYRTDLMRTLVKNISFNNPNSLEAALDSVKTNISSGYLCCYPAGPRLINIPANRVQNAYKNRTTNSITAAELNELFLQGNQIDIEEYQGIKPNTVHVPVDIKMKTE